jgi:uncharacterized integral membrane protein
MGKIVSAVIFVPLAVVIVIFAVANREIVTLSLDPFDSAQPAYAIRMPLFILIFVLVILGVVVGGTATWFKQHKWRARARRAEAEARDLRARLDARSGHAVPAPAQTVPPFAVPPAA